MKKELLSLLGRWLNVKRYIRYSNQYYPKDGTVSKQEGMEWVVLEKCSETKQDIYRKINTKQFHYEGIPIQIEQKGENVRIISNKRLLKYPIRERQQTERKIGQCEYPQDKGRNICLLPEIGELIVAGDGSYKDGESAYGFSINLRNKITMMCGGSKCNSYPLTASSFDAEAYGALAITSSLIEIVPKVKRKPEMAFTAYIDNEAVVKYLTKLIEHGTTMHPITPCYEIFRQLKLNLEELGIRSQWKWIKSHQKDHSNPIINLNNKVDELATHYRENGTEQDLNILPNAKVLVLHKQRPIHSK